MNNNNNKSFNQYEENEYNPNPNYDEKENNNNNMKVNDEEPYMIKNYNVNEFNDYINNIESNSFINNNKRKSLGDNSVNLFELNQKIKNSTDKLSLNSFERKIPTNNFLNKNEFENKYEFPNNENLNLKYNNNKKEANIYENNDNNDNKKENSFNFYNENKRDNSFNFYREKNRESTFNYLNDNDVSNKTDIFKAKFEPKTIKNNLNTNLNNYNNTNNYFNNNIFSNNINKYNNNFNTNKNNINNNFNFSVNDDTFYSLQIDSNIPTDISEFGNYLISHIEKEENYKTLFLREIKSFKMKIKRIFSNSGSNDHCLTDYLLDIWDKMEISYYTRYQILNNIVNLDANNLYVFLDRETEYLTNYYNISEDIFKKIKKRENIKTKLQIKSNRNEIILPGEREQFDRITQILEDDLRSFEEKYEGINIVWKGIYYKWFMNYEKWFYEMEQKNNFDI